MPTTSSGAESVTLATLLSYRDEKFIDNAYQTLLGRSPDPEGMKYYRARISAGISKLEILSQLFLSKEGGSRSICVAGLDAAIGGYQLLKIPVLGRLLRLLGLEQSEQGVLRNAYRFKSASWKNLQEQVKTFLQGKTQASQKLARGHVRFHLDVPSVKFFTVVKNMCTVSGWAVDLHAKCAVKVRVVIGRNIFDSVSKQREDVQREFVHICELPLVTGFSCILKLPIGVYRLRIEVEGDDGSWIAVRSTVLVRIPGKTRVLSRRPKHSYLEWVRLDALDLKAKLPSIARSIEEMNVKPTFTVIVDTSQGKSGLRDTIASIRSQLYTRWELRVLTEPSLYPKGNEMKPDSKWLQGLNSEFVICLQSGQLLACNALYEFSAALNLNPDVDLLYGDQDSLNALGTRCDPFRKPGWSPDYLETFNYIGFTACFRTDIARKCCDESTLYGLVLEFTEQSTRVLHIAKILGHARKTYSLTRKGRTNTAAQDIAALTNRLRRTDRRGVVRENESNRGCYDIKLDLKEIPKVSIVIPTAGKTVTVGDRSIDLIVNVIDQIRNVSTYKSVEIIVVDNGNLSTAQLAFLANYQCKLITYDQPVFNIAKKLNLGASLATGEVLLLMNDDIEVIVPSWIESLLEHFEKPHVGVVGAKLIYPNMATQHVGVVQPFGNPDHVRRSFSRNDPGYFFSSCGVRNFSAVTGAVMMVKTGIYREVGGYTDELAVCFNDVDFCMKVGRLGLTVVYAPRAELIHMESLSRVVELDLNELAWFHQTWAAELATDRYYNDRFLTVEPPTFVPCVN